MPRIKTLKEGKFKLVYSTAEGRRSEISGKLGPRGEALLDLVVAALSFGEDCVTGLEDVITTYSVEANERRLAGRV